MRKRSSLDTEKVFFLPEELLIEILSWLEAKHLLRFKCVCKVWYSVISSKHLVDMHAMRTGLWIYNFEHKGESLKSDGIQEKITYLYSCGGFLLEKRVFLAPAMPSAIYRIRNPTTKRILDLPHPHKGVIDMGIFLNPSTSSYYVVSVYFDNKKKKVNLEFLDLGNQSNDACPNADLSWRTLKISVFDKVSRQQRCHFFYCMSSEGILYVLTLLELLSNPKIICVDLVKRTCKILNMPQSLRFNWQELRFQSWIDKPSVLLVREEKLYVWVLEDHKKEKWADTMVIPLPFLKQNPTLKRFIPLIHRDDDDGKDILIYFRGFKSCTFYDLGSKSFCTVPPLCTRVCKRVPATLVSLKGMQLEKERMLN